MTELEKMKIARSVNEVLYAQSDGRLSLSAWIDSEIARLEDPHAEAKERMKRWESADPTFAIVERQVSAYVRHLESELAKAKAAAEPLDPKRVLATAATLTDLLDVSDERKQSIRDALIWSVDDLKPGPYEVTE
jgi:hypothetical protein